LTSFRSKVDMILEECVSAMDNAGIETKLHSRPSTSRPSIMSSKGESEKELEIYHASARPQTSYASRKAVLPSGVGWKQNITITNRTGDAMKLNDAGAQKIRPQSARQRPKTSAGRRNRLADALRFSKEGKISKGRTVSRKGNDQGGASMDKGGGGASNGADPSYVTHDGAEVLSFGDENKIASGQQGKKNQLPGKKHNYRRHKASTSFSGKRTKKLGHSSSSSSSSSSTASKKEIEAKTTSELLNQNEAARLVRSILLGEDKKKEEPGRKPKRVQHSPASEASIKEQSVSRSIRLEDEGDNPMSNPPLSARHDSGCQTASFGFYLPLSEVIGDTADDAAGAEAAHIGSERTKALAQANAVTEKSRQIDAAIGSAGQNAHFDHIPRPQAAHRRSAPTHKDRKGDYAGFKIGQRQKAEARRAHLIRQNPSIAMLLKNARHSPNTTPRENVEVKRQTSEISTADSRSDRQHQSSSQKIKASSGKQPLRLKRRKVPFTPR